MTRKKIHAIFIHYETFSSMMVVFHLNYLNFFFRTCYTYKESNLCMKIFNFEIFHTFIRFGVSSMHLCYFYGDVCAYIDMYVCVCLCMWVNMITCKRFIRYSSNLICILHVTVGRTLLILVNVGYIVILQEYKKEFLCIRSMW